MFPIRFLLIFGVVYSMDIDLIKTYFQLYNINTITFFHCHEIRYNKVIMMELLDYRVSFQKIDTVTEFRLAPTREGFVLDSECANVTKLVRKLTALYMFYGQQFWLIFAKTTLDCRGEISSFGYNLLSNQSIYVNSNVVWAQRCNDSSWELFEVHRIFYTKPLKSVFVGTYPENVDDLGLNLRNAKIGRQNFDGALFKAGMVIAFKKEFTFIEDVRKRGVEPFLKRTYPSMALLAEDMNFRVEIKIADDYGWPIENLTKLVFTDGLLRQYQLGEIDFSMHSVLVRLDRMQVCDYTAELAQVDAQMIYRQPPLSTVSNIYVLPFSPKVWFCVGSLIAVMSLVVIIELYITRSKEPTLKDLGIMELPTFILGAVCQQGFYLSPNTASLRLTMLLLFISMLFLFTSYSANIVSLLQTPSQAIRNLHDLVDSSLEVGVQNIPYNIHFIKESTYPVVKKLFEQKIQPKGDAAFLSPEAGMKRVRHGLYAFQIDTGTAYDVIAQTYTESEKCGLAEVELYQLPRQAGTVQKRSPLRDLFRIRLRWQRDIGLLDRVVKIWVPQKPKCESAAGGFVSVGMTEAMPAMKIFVFGVAISIVIFILEIIANKKIFCTIPRTRTLK